MNILCRITADPNVSAHLRSATTGEVLRPATTEELARVHATPISGGRMARRDAGWLQRSLIVTSIDPRAMESAPRLRDCLAKAGEGPCFEQALATLALRGCEIGNPSTGAIRIGAETYFVGATPKAYTLTSGSGPTRSVRRYKTCSKLCAAVDDLRARAPLTPAMLAVMVEAPQVFAVALRAEAARRGISCDMTRSPAEVAADLRAALNIPA